MLIAFERNAILGQNLNFERLKLAYVKKVTSRQTLNRKVEIGIESVDDELVLSSSICEQFGQKRFKVIY